MPHWSRKDRAAFYAGNPELDFLERMGPLNVKAAPGLLRRIRRSNSWRPMDAHGFEYASRWLPANYGSHYAYEKDPISGTNYFQHNGRAKLVGRKSGLVSAERLDIDGTTLLVRFSLEAFEADIDPDAAELDHAVLVGLWIGTAGSYWGDEPTLLDMLERATLAA